MSQETPLAQYSIWRINSVVGLINVRFVMVLTNIKKASNPIKSVAKTKRKIRKRNNGNQMETQICLFLLGKQLMPVVRVSLEKFN